MKNFNNKTIFTLIFSILLVLGCEDSKEETSDPVIRDAGVEELAGETAGEAAGESAGESAGEAGGEAAGEDVVAGSRTPRYITKKSREEAGAKEKSMEETMPKVFKELKNIFLKLENHYKDMQDIEFTVENKKLWML